MTQVTLKQDGKTLTALLSGEIDHHWAAILREKIDELADVKTAVSEAVTNCIVHAYANTIGPITLTAALYEDGTLRVAVADKGCGIPDVSKAMEPLFTTGGAERAGLGFAVMESFMDSVKVRSAPGKGTRVTLSKRLGTR